MSQEIVVLVVEDEPMIRMEATALVQDLGYRVYEADSADEAILLLEAHAEITIVFTDIQMAGTMDGLGLARLAADRWPPLRFIIVSGVLSPWLTKCRLERSFSPSLTRKMRSLDRWTIKSKVAEPAFGVAQKGQVGVNYRP